MGGGYIECGEFLGDDKSGTAVGYVLKDLRAKVRNKREADWLAEVDEVITGMFDGPAREEYRLTESVPHLTPILERYHADLAKQLDGIDPCEAPGSPAADAIDSGLGLDDTKWGGGIGWRYFCSADLLQAFKVCIDTDQPVVLSFD